MARRARPSPACGLFRVGVVANLDYAETRAGLRQMLTALASDQGIAVRVLLLARSTGDWWDQLGAGEPDVWDLVQAAKSFELAFPRLFLRYPTPCHRTCGPLLRARARRSKKKVEMDGTGRKRVLDLHAAALVAVLNEAASEVVQVNIGTVLDELLRHEMHLWYDSAGAEGCPMARMGCLHCSCAESLQLTACLAPLRGGGP